MLLKLSVDGGVRTGGVRGPTGGVSGPAAIGCVVATEDNTIIKKEGMFIGEATVNEAEYSALIRGLMLCQQLGADEVLVHSDSQLVVRQMEGTWRVRSTELKEYWEEANTEAGKFSTVKFKWVPRVNNQIADKLTRDVLDPM